MQDVLRDEGMAGEIEEVLVSDASIAASLGFAGSPTILVNGHDVEPAGSDRAVGLACRLYAHPESPGLPLRESIARAVREKNSREGSP